MASWDESSPRAVVVPPNLQQSRDILAANTDLALASPSSFGLGISLVSRTNPLEKTPLQLFYVTPQAARDRSAAASPLNAPGVKSGWYVIADPGAQFEVYISALHGAESVPRTTDKGDMIIASLYVDGDLADTGGDVFPGNAAGYSDASYPGFVESCSCDPVTGARNITYRQFLFYKTPTTETAPSAQNTDIGSMRLSLVASRKGIDAPLSRKRRANVLHDSESVSEKEAIKNGVSIGVRRDGERFMKQTVAFNYSTEHSTELPDCSVTIFMRERFWLVSRNIIDDKGNAVKYREKKVVSSEEVLVVSDDENVNDEDATQLKADEDANDVEDEESSSLKRSKFDPGEVIVLN